MISNSCDSKSWWYDTVVLSFRCIIALVLCCKIIRYSRPPVSAGVVLLGHSITLIFVTWSALCIVYSSINKPSLTNMPHNELNFFLIIYCFVSLELKPNRGRQQRAQSRFPRVKIVGPRGEFAFSRELTFRIKKGYERRQ